MWKTAGIRIMLHFSYLDIVPGWTCSESTNIIFCQFKKLALIFLILSHQRYRTAMDVSIPLFLYISKILNVIGYPPFDFTKPEGQHQVVRSASNKIDCQPTARQKQIVVWMLTETNHRQCWGALKYLPNVNCN